jgi:hypothetical protein
VNEWRPGGGERRAGLEPPFVHQHGVDGGHHPVERASAAATSVRRLTRRLPRIQPERRADGAGNEAGVEAVEYGPGVGQGLAADRALHRERCSCQEGKRRMPPRMGPMRFERMTARL